MSGFFRALCWLACCLSLKQARLLGRAIGWLAWTLRIRRRVAQANIAGALGLERRAARELARRVYGELGCGAVEFLQVERLAEQQAQAWIGGDALNRIESLREAGRGVLILSAHLGNWDLLACAAGRCGIPVTVVTRRLKQRSLNLFWMRQRQRCGVQLLPAEGSALAIRAALRRNEIVALVLDQHVPEGSVVPFFGRPAATTPALARLARATGAPVVPAFLLRQPGGFELRVLDRVVCPELGDDVAEMTARYSQIIEGQVRAAPAQWLWLHRRWKVPGAGFASAPPELEPEKKRC